MPGTVKPVNLPTLSKKMIILSVKKYLLKKPLSNLGGMITVPHMDSALFITALNVIVDSG